MYLAALLAVVATAVTPASYRPVIGAAAVTPARPVGGAPVTITYRVTRSDTGLPLTRAAMTCEPSVDGILVPHTDTFARGTVRLSLTLPEEGRALTVRVVVRANGRTALRTTRLPIVQVPKPAIAIDDVTAPEGNTGTSTFSVTVHLSTPSTRAVSVAYATAEGTADSATDFDAASGTIAFAPGETTKAIGVGVHGDLVQEPDETFTVHLTEPANATIARDTATGTIVGDELVLLSPAPGGLVLQNASGTGCAANPTRGTGFVIAFAWRTNGRPDIAAYRLYLIHPGATIALINAGLGPDTTSYLFRSCDAYVSGANLAGWTWTVTAYDGSGAPVAAATSTFSFSDCRLADGSYCH